MKLALNILVFFVFMSTSAAAVAQFQIGGGAGRLLILFDQSQQTQTIVYLGGVASPAYRVRVWASTDDVYEDGEVILDENRPSLAPGEQAQISYTRITPLPGDNRPLNLIVRSRYYYRECVEVTGMIPVCRSSSKGEAILPPDSAEPLASQGTSDSVTEIDYSMQTRNGEVPFDFLLLGWRDRALDRGPAAPVTLTEIPLNELELIEDGENQKRYKFNFASTPGIPGSFTVQQCYEDLRAPDNRRCGLTLLRSAIGYRQAQATITEGSFNDRIRVEWPRFALNFGFDAYRLRRCEVRTNGLENCVDIFTPSNGALERYDDLSVSRGVNYVYQVDACVGINLRDCDPTQYQDIALSPIGYRGLVDAFEDDDTAEQATTVTSSISQSRSFDIAEDQDWVRLVLRRPQAISIVTSGPLAADTEVTLYNSDLEELFYNDNPLDSRGPAFAELEIPIIAAGEYYLKVNQKIDDEPFFFSPVPNYTLDIKLEDISITPILLLLLDE